MKQRADANRVNYRALKYIVKRFILRRESLIATTSHYGIELHVKTEDVIGRHLYKYGAHDPDSTSFLERFVTFERNDVVLDIGANIGWYSLILDRMAGDLDVDIFAFEPEPTNFSLLEENIARNGATHVTAMRTAVAESVGVRNLHLFKASNRGRHSLLPIHDGDAVLVDTVCLDEFWNRMRLGSRIPRFIKIDIEGYELVALRGASKVLARCPLVMLEYSPAYMSAASLQPGELLDLMLGHGFAAHRLESGRLNRVDKCELLTSDRHRDLFWMR